MKEMKLEVKKAAPHLEEEIESKGIGVFERPLFSLFISLMDGKKLKSKELDELSSVEVHMLKSLVKRKFGIDVQ